MNRKGFTLIELILVFTILGLIAISVLPRFLNLATDAGQSARDGLVGAVRSGIALYRANDLASGAAGSYPSFLDTNPPATSCISCFDFVLANGVSDSKWFKNTQSSYTYNDGTNTTTYTYNVTDGTFQ